jgi:hypothetical protein
MRTSRFIASARSTSVKRATTLGATAQPILFQQASAQEAGVNEPILFVSHWGVKPGALDQLRQLSEEVSARFRAEKPRTLSWLAYLNDSSTSISFIHLFADAEAMDLHIEAAAAGRKASKDLIEPRGWEIYGTPSASALSQMRRTAEAAGVPLRLEPEVLAGGFLRLASA